MICWTKLSDKKTWIKVNAKLHQISIHCRKLRLQRCNHCWTSYTYTHILWRWHSFPSGCNSVKYFNQNLIIQVFFVVALWTTQNEASLSIPWRNSVKVESSLSKFRIINSWSSLDRKMIHVDETEPVGGKLIIIYNIKNRNVLQTIFCGIYFLTECFL